MMRWLMMLALVVLTAGCAGTPRGEPFQPEIVDPARAVVYVFRDGPARLRAKPVKVFINQEPAGPLLAERYLSKVVAPSEVIVRVEGESSSAHSVVLRAGDAAYLRVIVPRLGGVKPTIEVVDGETARAALARSTRSTPER
jgi:hypothetical protein